MHATCAVCQPRERAKHGVTAALAWLGAAHSWLLEKTPLTDHIVGAVCPTTAHSCSTLGMVSPVNTSTKMTRLKQAVLCLRCHLFCSGKHTLVCSVGDCEVVGVCCLWPGFSAGNLSRWRAPLVARLPSQQQQKC